MTKGQRTANRILDIAEELFARQGFDATSLRQIAELAQIQQPGLYKHFASKEALYQQVFDRALRPLTDVMDDVLAHRSDAATLLLMTDKLTDHLAQHPAVAKLLVRAAIAPDPVADAIAGAWLGRLVDYGRRITASTDYAPHGNNNDLLAVQIVAMFNVLFGYFWSASLIEIVADKPALQPSMVALQKELLKRFVTAFSTA